MNEIEINGIKINPQHYVDKWTAWALEVTPATDEDIVGAVEKLYAKCKVSKPEVKVFRDYDKFSSSVRDSVRDSVGDSVWASVGASVRASVRVDTYWRADDLAFADVFVDAKVLSQEKARELQEYKEILEKFRVSMFFEKVAYVLVAPTIRRDDTGRLSNDQRPSVEWENNTGLYFLDGVNLPKELWQKIVSKEMSLSEIMKIEIADQRTVALKYNPQAIIQENAKLIHADERDNELYLVENSEINKLTEFPKMYFLKMTCPTGRVFIEGVPPEEAEKNPSATDMQAFLCGLTKSEYYSMKLES